MFINSFLLYLVLILVGLCLGSFAGATMWRLRARQLFHDKLSGEKVDKKEYNSLKKLTNKSIVNDRSQCLNCLYVLRWYDLIPVISWLSLGGKCRECRKPIGFLEPVIEVSVALFFVLSYMFWPYTLNNGLEIARLILWLVAGVASAILFAYDKNWFLLPDSVNYLLIFIGVCSSTLIIIGSHDKVGAVLSIVGSVIILSGLYWILHLLSRGKWIGFGDVKLGLGLALLLSDWRLALVALFAANLVGCIIVLPSMVTGKLKRDSHVPFGPLLIIGVFIAALVGNQLVNLYLSWLS